MALHYCSHSFASVPELLHHGGSTSDALKESEHSFVGVLQGLSAMVWWAQVWHFMPGTRQRQWEGKTHLTVARLICAHCFFQKMLLAVQVKFSVLWSTFI